MILKCFFSYTLDKEGEKEKKSCRNAMAAVESAIDVEISNIEESRWRWHTYHCFQRALKRWRITHNLHVMMK